MPPVLNIAAYRFVALPDAEALRGEIIRRTDGLKGTVLLAGEGINLVLAGEPGRLRGFIDWLRADDRFTTLEVKQSWSDGPPFRRMRVKVKPEIIRMNRPAIRPQAGRAPAIDAATLKRWLDAGHDDAGRPVVTLDTRNAFEVDHGAFEQAIDWRLSSFGEFPLALAEHRETLAGKTVVTYCTGGIRCEKAALLMRAEGFEHVHQLDGGVLRYLETTGPASAPHWRGRCFVFDERVSLAADLSPENPAAAGPAP